LKPVELARLLIAACLIITSLLPQTVPVAASSERSLYLYYTHTRETARITFKRNGQYVQSGLNELNRFLRDWRRNEPANMDPALFDLLWEVYRDVGASQPIHVVSAYRSPQTNAMLRANSSGVAENSQHTRGKAMDFFIPGIPLNRLRAAAMRVQVGGVGYYPTSGSPFVHLDTGTVRAWPRMTRAQLQEIFPDGRTMHVPSDGRPLSQQGYQLAQAEWNRCRRVPCGGSDSGTQVASSGGNLMDMLFGNNNRNAPQPQAAAAAAPAPSAPAAAPAPTQVARVAPVPAPRPAALGGETTSVAEVAAQQMPFATSGSAPLTEDEMVTAVASIAPVPAMRPAALGGEAQNDQTAVQAIAALDPPPVPAPRIHMTNPPVELTAYANLPQDAEAQRALEMIIAREAPTVASAPPGLISTPALAGLAPISTGSIRPVPGMPAETSTLDDTFAALDRRPEPAPVAQALAGFVAAHSEARNVELIAPDLDHVAQALVHPVRFETAHFAAIVEHDEADLDPALEMGASTARMGVGHFPPEPQADRFAPLTVASR
jgi:uncharacterized protein YcbK (DUF882 family)